MIYLFRKWEYAYRPERKGFNKEFSDGELKQMNYFADFYLNRIGNIPNQLNELMKDPYWNAVCEYADELLQDFRRNEGSK